LSWPAAGPRRLLVIDDNPDFIDLINRYLDGQDWQVLGAGDGEAARQAIEQARPDTILLDVILPIEDGWDLLLSLKTGESTRSIPVLVCSALHEPGLVVALGGAAFLPKPLTRQALLEALAWLGVGGSTLGSGLPGSIEALG
jgi:CheY-like chemotaxis protein